MASSTADIITRHQVFLQRYANGLGKRYARSLTSVHREILKILRGGDEAVSMKALMDLRGQLESKMAQASLAGKKNLLKELGELGGAEAAWSASLLGSATTVAAIAQPHEMQVEVAAAKATFESTRGRRVSMARSLESLGVRTGQQVKQIINDGFLLGDTTKDIAKSIRESARLTESRANTLARTGTNHVSNVARDETYKRNGDIVTGYEWVATLDSRTTLICAGRDGEVYPVTPDSPKPPAHFNCRSTTVPVLDPEFDISPEQSTRQARGLDGKTKRVKATTTYGDWLKKQPAGFQDEYFSKFKDGKAKAKLFRKGGLKIDKFSDAGGAEYSLTQLKALNPLEFDRAGLD